MAHVITTAFVAGTPALASAVNANFDAIKTAINGGLDATNLANAAVTENKIADNAVTSAKVAAGLDAARIANGLVSNAEFQYLDGVTSAIQTQINSKQATVTGGATTILVADLIIDRALLSNAQGKVGPSVVTRTELEYLDGVTSAIQTQLNAKQATITGAASTIVTTNFTPNRALVSDASGKVAQTVVTSTELGYLDGVTSAIQTQLNGKAPTSHTHPTTDLTGTIATAQIADGAVSNAKIASGVDAAKLTTGTLPIARIANGAVTGTKLATTAVGDRGMSLGGAHSSQDIPNNTNWVIPKGVYMIWGTVKSNVTITSYLDGGGSGKEWTLVYAGDFSPVVNFWLVPMLYSDGTNVRVQNNSTGITITVRYYRLF